MGRPFHFVAGEGQRERGAECEHGNGGAGSDMTATGAIELVDIHLAAERIAVNAKRLSGAGLIPVEALEDALDEFFLEFADGFFEQNSALDHHADQKFQLIFHDCTLQGPGDDLRARAGAAREFAGRSF